MESFEIPDRANIHSAALDVSLTSFYRSGTLSSSASIPSKAVDSSLTSSPVIPSQYHDFLSFLAICQTREIDFLGITWDRALDDNSDLIGLGLTSEIRPGTLNLDVTFAFKRLTDSNYAQAAMASSQERRHQAYEALISEISVLGHPIIRDNENIIRLEGVCWDFLSSDQEEKVRPVLVFEKAKQGDLGRFMKSLRGQELTWEQKLKLCSDIVRGVATMHSCGIVHGDIKPHNVLVFRRPDEGNKDHEGNIDEYVAKVADFGYSTCTRVVQNALRSNRVILPWSPPWNAPEVNADHHTLSTSEAKLADAFSLGMTCLWLLFMKVPLEKSGGSLKREHDWLSVLKSDGKLKPFAFDKIDGSAHLTKPKKDAIKTFFELTLSPEPDKRSTDFHQLLILLNPNEDRTESPQIPVIPVTEQELFANESLFELPRNLIQFAATDFRLRQYIITCLQNEAQTCDSQSCKENAAFQLAFSYMTGFAYEKDDSAALDAVKKSGKSIDDLTTTIQNALLVYQPYRNQHVTRLISEGYVHETDLANEYRNLGLLEASELYYKREIQDMKSAFQNDNVIVRLETTLADILHSQGKYDEEEILLKKIVEKADADIIFRQIYAGDPESLKTRLARVYLNNGLYEKALGTFQESLKRTEERVGKHHPQTLSTSLNFASVLQQLGQYEAAESIARECLLQHERALGSDHPHTVIVLENLATLLFDQKHYEQALEMMQSTVHLNEKWFGPDHHNTLISLNNIATMETNLRKYESAEKTSQLIWEKMSNLLGPEHPHTVTSLSTYGMTLFVQEKDDAAEVVFRQAFDGMKKSRRKGHHDILISMNNLAMVLLKRNEFVEARQIMQLILDEREPRVIRNLNVLRNFVWIGSIFMNQGLYDIAEQLLRLAIAGEELVLGLGAKRIISNLNILASILLERENFAEAEAVSRAALEKCNEHPDDQLLPLDLRNSLAVALEVQGKYEEAVEVHSQSLQAHERVLGPLHPSTLTCINNLGIALSGQKSYAESEELHRRAMKGYEDTLGLDHEDTLTSANNLAAVIAKQGRLDEAADLYQKTLEALIKVSGPEHVSSQKCKKNLDFVLRKIKESKSITPGNNDD